MHRADQPDAERQRVELGKPPLHGIDQLESRGVLSERATGARGQRRYVAAELLAAVTDD